jgi:Domain of unknown function (DUF5615)
MKVRLYLDEDATATALVVALRARDIDALTVEEAHMRGRSDEEQLRYATQQGRVIYTFNVGHFMALHRRFMEQGESHAGIILAANGRWSPGEQTRRIALLTWRKTAEDMINQVEYLRNCLKRSTSKTTKHKTGHSNVNHGFAAPGQHLVVAGQSSGVAQPCECPLDYPSPRQYYPAFHIFSVI